MTRQKTVVTDGGVEKSLYIPEHLAETYLKAVEQADDAAIVARETSGQMLAHWVYEFEQGGEKIRGLTVDGVTELFFQAYKAMPMAQECVTSSRPHPEAGKNEGPPQGAMLHQVAVRLLTPDGKSGRWGVVEQAEYARRRNGSWYFDIHAMAKATGKAERNAQRKLIQPRQVSKFVKLCLDGKSGAGRVKLLTEKDARGESAETPTMAGKRARVFAIAGAALDMGQANNKNRLIKWIEAKVGKPMSSMTEEEMMGAGNFVKDAMDTMGKEKFAEMVKGVEL